MAYQNFFATKLANDIGAADTTINLDTAPTATSGRMVLEARNPTQREVIKYTGVSGLQLTGVVRGQGGTTAKNHTKNSLVEQNMTAEDIQDLYDAFASFSATNNDWRNLPYTVGTVTPNGNGSYTFPINGVDLTGVLSEGMRLRTTRTVAASNTSFSLDGTNDYYVKTSPNKMTWTDDFATGWWIYLTSYAVGGIASRYNGTSGWTFTVEADGTLKLRGFNASSANKREVNSIQSVPLNKWVHVAAQLDMSAHTATTTTSYIMINGKDVPASVAQGGTNPTSLIQAGNFEIGSYNGGVSPFPGYIGDGGVFSTKKTQAEMLAFMNQPPTGSETGIVSAYANGSVNDLNTTTPNNLTATNGATTVANAPYGNSGVSTTKDYAVIMAKPTFSTNTTVTVQVPEGCTLPTTGGISSIDYSSVKAPFGFPTDENKWELETFFNSTLTQNVASVNDWYVLLAKLSIPIGAWIGGYQAVVRLGGNSGAAAIYGSISLTENTTTYTNATFPAIERSRKSDFYHYGTGTVQIEMGGNTYKEFPVKLATQTVYSLSGHTEEAGGGFIFRIVSGTKIFARNAYI